VAGEKLADVRQALEERRAKNSNGHVTRPRLVTLFPGDPSNPDRFPVADYGNQL